MKEPPQEVPSARGLRVAIVRCRFNGAVVDGLLEGARQALAEMGAAPARVTIVDVPGAFELPLAARAAAESSRFDAVIAPSCSDIFRNNCTKNGLVPVVVPEATVHAIWDAIEADPNVEITIDVERLTVEVPSAGITASFPMEPQNQYRFLNGLDDVGITLGLAAAIDDYELRRPTWLS